MKLNDGISEIIGAIILIGIVFTGMALVAVLMTSNPPPDTMAKAVLSGSCKRCDSYTYSILLKHDGGEPVDPATLLYFINTFENSAMNYKVKPDLYFDTNAISTMDIEELACIPNEKEETSLNSMESNLKTVNTETISVADYQYTNVDSWPVGNVLRIWYDMRDENFCLPNKTDPSKCDYQKPRGVQIWTSDKKFENSLKVPEFKVIKDEDLYLDPENYYGDYKPKPAGGTGGTGGTGTPPSPSALTPEYVENSLCRCGHEKQGGGNCVAQFTYKNNAGVEFNIPIRGHGDDAWNEFTADGMNKQFHCQPEIFKANPTDEDRFWTLPFWNNIKWKLGNIQSVKVDCTKEPDPDKKNPKPDPIPQCSDMGYGYDPCSLCTS